MRTTRPLLDAQNTRFASASMTMAVIASPSPSSRAISLDRLVVAAAPRVVSRLANAVPPSLVAHAYVTISVVVSDARDRRTERADVFPSRDRVPPRPSSFPSSPFPSSSPPPPVVIHVVFDAVAIAIGAPRPT
jgi:hypothetical protein